jgi:hypothetical protein
VRRAWGLGQLLAGLGVLGLVAGGLLLRRPQPRAPVVSETPVARSAPARRRLQAPKARANAAMAYDEAAGRVLLYGGAVANAFGSPEARDAWSWDGTEWTRIDEVRGSNGWPPYRYRHAMCSDPVRKRIVLFGGRDSTGARDDTWEWDGARWLLLDPPVVAESRWGARMAYESQHGRILLLGGQDGQASSCWDAGRWGGAGAFTKPPALENAVLATDEARGRIVLFGNPKGRAQETWEWDGVKWARISTEKSPPWLNSSQMVYDVARMRIVLFGGALTQGTWEFDGTHWEQRHPEVSPAGRMEHSMAYDRKRRRVVLFGGHGKHRALGDTWEWDGSNWKLVCPPAE